MLKIQIFLFLIPFSLSHHNQDLNTDINSSSSFTTILKHNQISKRMDKIKYNFVLNVEDFEIFEDINFKFSIKHNIKKVKIKRIYYQFIDNEKFTFESFDKLNKSTLSSVTVTTSHYYHYFQIEKINGNSKYLLIQIELNSNDPSNVFTLKNTEKFEGGFGTIGLLLISIIFIVCVFGCLFGLFYGIYKIIKSLFPLLFYQTNQFNNYPNNFPNNNIIQYPQMINNGYIYPVVAVNSDNMNNYYMNYSQPPQIVNINQNNYPINMEQAPINVVNDSNITNNSSTHITPTYEKPH